MTARYVLLLVAAGSVVARAIALVLIVPHHGGVTDQLCHFDCGWYERIALSGYGADADWDNLGSAPHWAFFPLYPLLMRALVAISGATAQQGGIAISLVASAIMAATIGGEIGRRGRGAVAAMILVLAFPLGLFFSLVYAEALYGMLVAASLAALRRGRPLRAAVWASLAGATRPAGILLAPVIALERLGALFAQRRWSARVLADSLLPIAIAPLGLSAFVFAQYLAVGDGFAFAHVQILWGRSWSDPFARILHGLMAHDLGGLFGAPSRVWHALWAVIGLLAGGWLLLRRRMAEGWFLLGTVLLPAATGLDAMPRFVGTNPVFLTMLAERVAALPRWPRWLVLLACVAGQLFLLRIWARGAGGVF